MISSVSGAFLFSYAFHCAQAFEAPKRLYNEVINLLRLPVAPVSQCRVYIGRLRGTLRRENELYHSVCRAIFFNIETILECLERRLKKSVVLATALR